MIGIVDSAAVPSVFNAGVSARVAFLKAGSKLAGRTLGGRREACRSQSYAP
jgi:hypothetical protein